MTAPTEAEFADAALYDRRVAGTRRPDLRAVSGNLRDASRERHPPAFRRCCARYA
jgi:hypothetical protein